MLKTKAQMVKGISTKTSKNTKKIIKKNLLFFVKKKT
jgi:hypothetical protein